MTGSPVRDETDRSHELRRADIVDAALRMLNEVGLEKLSVRGVAQELGMHPPGLYWYIESKQDLMDRMAAAILEDGYRELRRIAPGESWSTWLVVLAMQARATLLRYRDGARVVAGAYLFRTNGITPWIEVILEVLEDAGFTREQAMGGALTVLRYTTSVVLDEQISPPFPPRLASVHIARHAKQLTAQEVPMRTVVIDATQWPRTAAAMESLFGGPCQDVASFRERHFILGLELIVAGMWRLR